MNQAEIYANDTGFDRFYKTYRNLLNEKLAGVAGDKISDAVTVVPDFAYLLVKLMADADVPRGRKLDLLGTLLYVVSPLDVFPDKWRMLGKLDDAYVTMMSLAKTVGRVEWEVLMRYWLSDPKILEAIRTWLTFLDQKFGSGFIKQLMKTLKTA